VTAAHVIANRQSVMMFFFIVIVFIGVVILLAKIGKIVFRVKFKSVVIRSLKQFRVSLRKNLCDDIQRG
jgi:hypothetical protein